MKSKEITLTENFVLCGSEETDFFEAIKLMDDATEPIEMETKKMVFYAVINDERDLVEVALGGTPNKLKTLDEALKEYETVLEDCKKNNDLLILMCKIDQTFKLTRVSVDGMKSLGITDQMISELRTKSKMIVKYDGKSYVVSPFAYTTLLARAGLGGDVMNRPYVGRVIEIAKSLFYRRPQTIKTITRSVGGARIIVGAHSSGYCYIPQTTLTYIYEKIARDYGKTKCLGWGVTHSYSYCYIGFPDIADDFAAMYGLPDGILPGLCISTSDTGDSSIIIRGIWNMKGGSIAGETAKRNHRGTLDVDEFVKACADSIFKKYNSIPEKLCKLMEIDITNPAATLKKVFKKIKVASAIGKKEADALYELICAEFMASMKYTAYDIAIEIITLPERISGLSHSKMEKFEKIAFDAVKVSHYKDDEDDDEEPSSIVIV